MSQAALNMREPDPDTDYDGSRPSNGTYLAGLLFPDGAGNALVWWSDGAELDERCRPPADVKTGINRERHYTTNDNAQSGVIPRDARHL